jgi:hypothetical protein
LALFGITDSYELEFMELPLEIDCKRLRQIKSNDVRSDCHSYVLPSLHQSLAKRAIPGWYENSRELSIMGRRGEHAAIAAVEPPPGRWLL